MPKTLLLADDSVTIQKVVGISFANEDFVLETVDNGDAAVERAAEIRPDIVLADVVMPGKSGYEVCEAIKANPDLAGVPVLLLTGTFEAFDEDRARQAGADGHITKPFEAQALVDAVKARLAAAAASADVGAEEAPTPALAVPSEGFDFLEDDQTEPSGLVAAPDDAQVGVPVETPDTAPGGEAFAFEAPGEGDSDLGIGEPDLEAGSDLEQSAPDLGLDTTPDRTQLVMPDVLAAEDTLPPADLAPDLEMASPPETPTFDSDDATRVVFAEDGEAVVPSGDLLGDPLAAMPEDDAVFDPTGARDFDVSSSDLGEPIPSPALDESTAPQPESSFAPEAPASDAAPDATRIFELPVTPEPATPEPVAPAPMALQPITPEPVATSEPIPFDTPPPSETDPFGFAASAPSEPETFPPAYDTLDAPEALAASEPAPLEVTAETSAVEPYTSPFDDDFPADTAADPSAVTPDAAGRPDLASDADLSEPLVAAPEPSLETPPVALHADAEPTSEAAAALPDLGPLLRDQLHDTLEKIAWEAFGEVAEAIVKQTLERVEQVAWEVIPQMAEALIQEEIRKLKGEDKD
jgi:CheY-like chemotaxis protein